MDLVTSLLQDDDDDAELWYIMGLAALSTVPPDKGTARHYFSGAKQIMTLAMENQQYDYSDKLELIDQHLAMLGDIPPTEEGEGDENGDEDDEDDEGNEKMNM